MEKTTSNKKQSVLFKQLISIDDLPGFIKEVRDYKSTICFNHCCGNFGVRHGTHIPYEHDISEDWITIKTFIFKQNEFILKDAIDHLGLQ